MPTDRADLISRWIGSMSPTEVNMVEDAIRFWRERAGVTPSERVKTLYYPQVIGYKDPVEQEPTCLHDAPVNERDRRELGYTPIFSTDTNAEELMCWACGDHLIEGYVEDGE